MIRVVMAAPVTVVSMTANVDVRSRPVIFRFAHGATVMRVRKAQTLVGQHQKDEQ